MTDGQARHTAAERKRVNMSQVLDSLRAAIEAAGARFYRLAVWQGGTYEQHDFCPMSSCANIYSISKCLTATGVGLAADRGLLGIDDPVRPYLEQWVDAWPEGVPADLAVRHLLTQTAGIARGSLFEGDRYEEPGDDWIGRVLSRPFPHRPGTFFAYDNGNYYLLSCIVEAASGETLDVFLGKHLFDELDMPEFAWERCPRGHVMGATGCYMRADELVKLGRLYLQDGEWEGRRVLSSAFIREAGTPCPAGGAERYGFSLRCMDNGDVYAPGAHNQILYISRACGAVAVLQGFDETLDLPGLIASALRG